MVKYALNTSTIRNCGLSLPAKIELAAQTGYAGIELWVSEIDAYLAEGGTLAQLRALLVENDIAVPNLIAFFQWANPDPTQRAAALDEAIAVFETAQALACPYVAAPPAGIYERDDISAADIASYYRSLLDATSGMGVQPLLEFWGGAKTLGSLRAVIEVVNLLGDTPVILLADVFHLAKTEGSFELLGTLDGAQLGLFHMNDYPDAPDIRQLSDAQRVYPGDGVAPLGQIVETLGGIGYTGFFSLELFNRTYEEAGAASVVQTGFSKMQQVLE